MLFFDDVVRLGDLYDVIREVFNVLFYRKVSINIISYLRVKDFDLYVLMDYLFIMLIRDLVKLFLF